MIFFFAPSHRLRVVDSVLPPKMSLTQSSPAKKRKHEDAGEKGTPSHKKPKKEGKKHKGKGSKSDGQFQVVNASIVLSIPPKFASDPLAGALEMLDSLVMRHAYLLHLFFAFLTRQSIGTSQLSEGSCSVIRTRNSYQTRRY